MPSGIRGDHSGSATGPRPTAAPGSATEAEARAAPALPVSLTVLSPCSPDAATAKSQKFVADFKAKYGQNPTGLGALGYDAAGVLFAAIRSSGKTDPKGIRDALTQVKNSSNPAIEPCRPLSKQLIPVLHRSSELMDWVVDTGAVLVVVALSALLRWPRVR